MPGGDGTGPMGSGPNGWQRGPCMNTGTGWRGFGPGRGFGRGMGRGRGVVAADMSEGTVATLTREVAELRRELGELRQAGASTTGDSA